MELASLGFLFKFTKSRPKNRRGRFNRRKDLLIRDGGDFLQQLDLVRVEVALPNLHFRQVVSFLWRNYGR